MIVLFQVLPVALAVAGALTVALVFTRSLLSLLFDALRRLGPGAPASRD